MSRRAPLRVALTGFGSVGRAFARILDQDSELPVVITAVADRGGYVTNQDGLSPQELLEAKRKGTVAAHRLGQPNAFDREALEASRAEVLVELASTSYSDGQPGWGYVQTALDLGLDVVLASKGPMVAHWDELFDLAGKRETQVRFSATHGAPLPVVDMARFGLAGSRLTSIRALFNSTTGILLEQMEAGMSLAEAVRSAQDAGVAETDPSLDVEGWDAAAKCVIVGRALSGQRLSLEGVRRKGIEDLTTDEVQAAARSRTPIKLLCRIDFDGDKLAASVSPSRIDAADPLSTLRKGALGIVYDAEQIGRMFVAAYGAGGTPTAAAVIRDILSLA